VSQQKRYFVAGTNTATGTSGTNEDDTYTNGWLTGQTFYSVDSAGTLTATTSSAWTVNARGQNTAYTKKDSAGVTTFSAVWTYDAEGKQLSQTGYSWTAGVQATTPSCGAGYDAFTREFSTDASGNLVRTDKFYCSGSTYSTTPVSQTDYVLNSQNLDQVYSVTSSSLVSGVMTVSNSQAYSFDAVGAFAGFTQKDATGTTLYTRTNAWDAHHFGGTALNKDTAGNLILTGTGTSPTATTCTVAGVSTPCYSELSVTY
jgi:hypothetical protein